MDNHAKHWVKPGAFRLFLGVVLVLAGLGAHDRSGPSIVFFGQILVLFGAIRLALNPLIDQNHEIIDLLKRQQANGKDDVK